MAATSIEWADHTANPIRARRSLPASEVRGPKWENVAIGHYCEKISPGCANCYASTLQKRFRMPAFPGQSPGAPALPANNATKTGAVAYLDEAVLAAIRKRRKPTRYFIGDMTDVFGWWVPDEWLDAMFATFWQCPQHTFMLLTKRPERMRSYLSDSAPLIARLEKAAWPTGGRPGISRPCDIGFSIASNWPLPNVWLGVSAENQKTWDERIPILAQTPAAVRFVSVEPMLERIDFGFSTGYNRHDESTSQRKTGLSGGAFRGTGNRQRGENLAIEGPSRSEGTAGRIAVDTMRSPTGGSGHRELSPGPGDDQRRENSRLSASTGLVPFSRGDSRESDSESQIRQPESESSRRFGTSDLFGELPARGQSVESRPGSKPERGTQPRGEADGGTGQRDSTATGSGGIAESIGDGIRGSISGDFQNSPQGSLGISWIILGGESGHGARPCNVEWIRDGLAQCKAAGVAAFVKQIGPNPYLHKAGSLDRQLPGGRMSGFYETTVYLPKPVDRKGGDPAEWPDDLRVREFPQV